MQFSLDIKILLKKKLRLKFQNRFLLQKSKFPQKKILVVCLCLIKIEIYCLRAINNLLKLSMKKIKRNNIGLGINDPKGIFGTTRNLNKIFKRNRLFEFPTAENGMTGIAIGSSLMGLRPVITHQRLSFHYYLLSKL